MGYGLVGSSSCGRSTGAPVIRAVAALGEPVELSGGGPRNGHSPTGSGGVTPRPRYRRCERIAEPKGSNHFRSRGESTDFRFLSGGARIGCVARAPATVNKGEIAIASASSRGARLKGSERRQPPQPREWQSETRPVR